MDPNDLRQELRRIRRESGLSTTVLAAKIGKSQSLISGVETGATSTTIDVAVAWAEACGCEVAFPRAGHAEPSQLSPDDHDLLDQIAQLLPTLDQPGRAALRAVVLALETR